MFEHKLDKDGHILMEYPFETAIPLEKGVWVVIAHLLLKMEGLEQVDVKLEPGKWYKSSESWGPFLGAVIDFVIGPKTVYLLGSHVAYWRTSLGKKRKTYEVIHLAVNREDKEILSTLLHEIAHAKHVGDDHGKKWETEYLRLMEEYYSTSSAGVIVEVLSDLYDSQPMLHSK